MHEDLAPLALVGVSVDGLRTDRAAVDGPIDVAGLTHGTVDTDYAPDGSDDAGLDLIAQASVIMRELEAAGEQAISIREAGGQEA